MYDIGYFKAEEKQDILAFMQAHSFATVIGTNQQLPVASHLPLHIVEENNELFFFRTFDAKVSTSFGF
jgi:transcriptional regulator